MMDFDRPAGIAILALLSLTCMVLGAVWVASRIVLHDPWLLAGVAVTLAGGGLYSLYENLEETWLASRRDGP